MKQRNNNIGKFKGEKIGQIYRQNNYVPIKMFINLHAFCYIYQGKLWKHKYCNNASDSNSDC